MANGTTTWKIFLLNVCQTWQPPRRHVAYVCPIFFFFPFPSPLSLFHRTAAMAKQIHRSQILFLFLLPTSPRSSSSSSSSSFWFWLTHFLWIKSSYGCFWSLQIPFSFTHTLNDHLLKLSSLWFCPPHWYFL